MKIALLSGAYKNAGDFLIVERSRALLRHVYPDCEFLEYKRLDDLTDLLGEINSCDVTVLAGGPAYRSGAMPISTSITQNLRDIRAKIFIMGSGWNGKDGTDDTVYTYDLSGKMREFLTRACEDTGTLGCRDWFSVRALKHAGVDNTVMTGCPAWYNLDFIDKLKPRKLASVKRICISDPARIKVNVNNEEGQAVSITSILRKAYPEAEMTFVFHRGIDFDAVTGEPERPMKQRLFVKNAVEAMGVKCIDISYSAKGLSVYDDCDLHVGYRVHAHIYNLSRGNTSILIEEDGRGAGVNQALGLPSIVAYSYKPPVAKGFSEKIRQKMCYQEKKHPNPHAANALNDLLDRISVEGEALYGDAFARLRRYYDVMIRHLELLREHI